VKTEKNPDGDYKAAQLVRANQALYDYTKAFEIPLISGKDSMKNDSTIGGRRVSIPPTVLFSTIAKMKDITKAVTMDPKTPGDLLYVIGLTKDELGASEYLAMHNAIGNNVPTVDAEQATLTFQRLAAATERELCQSISTPASGGLAICMAKKAIAGGLGMTINLNMLPVDDPALSPHARLFSESNSRFVATVSPDHREAFEKTMQGVPFAHVGDIIEAPELTIDYNASPIAHLTIDDMEMAYTKTLDNI
jgi:phosphoribosylformylglycinamidine synthase